MANHSRMQHILQTLMSLWLYRILQEFAEQSKDDNIEVVYVVAGWTKNEPRNYSVQLVTQDRLQGYYAPHFSANTCSANLCLLHYSSISQQRPALLIYAFSILPPFLRGDIPFTSLSSPLQAVFSSIITAT